MAENDVETVELVSPDGETTRTVRVNSNDETKLRWDGWQTAAAPVVEEAPKAQARRSGGEPTPAPAA